MAGPPRVLGRRYQLQRQIGSGGMGAVWLAVDEVLGREVAVKRVGMFPGGTSPDLLRAQREAKLAARLNHPHVVSVFDFVTEGDEQWLVMEYVVGTNLSALAKERAGLPPEEAAGLVGQVAEALAAAHSAGIVHRDVKPSNILVTPDGTAKLADFGIARARADATMTASGVVTGTPAYLAPEVVSGQTATEASDVWSLGATLFHTLTGEPPYDVHDNLLGAMYRIVHEDPPRLPHLGWPAGLLDHTMATSPAERWPMTLVREYLRVPPAAEARAAPTDADTAVVATEPNDATLFMPVVDDGTEDALDEDALDEDPLDEDALGRADVLVSGASAVDDAVVQPASERSPRPGRSAMVLALLAALLLAGFAGWSLLRDDSAPTAGHGPTTGKATPRQSPTRSASHRQSPRASRTPSPSHSPSRSPSATATSSTPNASGAPSSARMRTFVERYIATALTDPATSWRELTPRFQARVGSYSSYAGFWDTIESATLRDVHADPATMVVSYVITWDPKGPGGTEDETVVLDLVQDNGQLLIDRER